MASGNNWGKLGVLHKWASGGSVTLVFFVFPFISFNSGLALKAILWNKSVVLNSIQIYLTKCLKYIIEKVCIYG